MKEDTSSLEGTGAAVKVAEGWGAVHWVGGKERREMGLEGRDLQGRTDHWASGKASQVGSVQN